MLYIFCELIFKGLGNENVLEAAVWVACEGSEATEASYPNRCFLTQ